MDEAKEKEAATTVIAPFSGRFDTPVFCARPLPHSPSARPVCNRPKAAHPEPISIIPPYPDLRMALGVSEGAGRTQAGHPVVICLMDIRHCFADNLSERQHRHREGVGVLVPASDDSGARVSRAAGRSHE